MIKNIKQEKVGNTSVTLGQGGSPGQLQKLKSWCRIYKS